MARFTSKYGIGDWIQFTVDDHMVISEIFKVEFIGTGSIYYSTSAGMVMEEHVREWRKDPAREDNEPMRTTYGESFE